jgi:hypothetical protein
MTDDPTRLMAAPAVAQQMADAARRFLASLSADGQAAARFDFGDAERYVWHYTPVDRKGLRLKDMTAAQREAAFLLLDSGLSARGAATAREIVALEPILREIERAAGDQAYLTRDPERYYFSIFGEPGGAAPWGWRVGGHHVCLHFTVVDRELIAPTPLFFGANPAEVRHGPAAGKRALAAEEDLARALLASLNAEQKAVAVVDPVAPRDILTKNYRSADPGAAPAGIRYAALSGEQRERLVGLIRHYTGRAAGDVDANAWRRIERAGLEPVTFAWAGPEERGQGHYYAVKGPSFLIEYDNTQNNANHIHAVWRDYADDWGEDLLAAHYAAAHAG